MSGAFVFLLLAIACVAALLRPAWGIVAFYGFLMLDPQWNWRWNLPPGIPFQKYIFYCVFLGFALSGFRAPSASRLTKIGLAAMLGFFAICVLSAQQSIAPESSSFFMSIFWKQLLVLGIALLVMDEPGKIKLLLLACVLGQGYNALQINLDYFASGFSTYAFSKWGSYNVDNNGYSIITVPIIGMSLCLAFFEKKLWLRMLCMVIAGLQIHQIMLMESRGCMLACVAMILLITWKIPKTTANKLVTISGFLAIGLLAGPSVVNEFSSSFDSGENLDSSAESRFYLWKAGMRITADYPLLGTGPNAARNLVPLPQYYDGQTSMTTKALHNLFFDVTTGVGIPGAMIYFWLFLAPFWYCWRTYSKSIDDETAPLRLSVCAGLLGYLAASMFSSGLLFESCYVLVIAGFALTNVDPQPTAPDSVPTI